MTRMDRKLRKLLQLHPLAVQPKRKADTLAYVTAYWGDKEERPMKNKHPARLLLTAIGIFISLFMLISAAVAGYYYLTPTGVVVDENGNPAETAVSTETMENDTSISGNSWRIASVTWTSVQGRTTLAVWVTEASPSFNGLRAVTADGEVYHLTETTFNLGSSYIGYTTSDIPKPVSLTLECEEPAFSCQINFQPQDVIPAESFSNGLTLFGTTAGNTVYIGINDDNFLHTELADTAELVFATTELETVKDTAGNVLKNKGGSSNLRDTVLTTRQVYETAEGEHIAFLHTNYISVIYDFMNAVMVGTAPHVYVPVPEEGELLTGKWILLDCDGFRYEIDSVRKEGDVLYFTSDDGLQYTGEYTISDDMRKFIYLCVPGLSDGENTHSAGGSQYEWNIRFLTGKIEELQNESGELPVYLWQLGMSYEGDWTLNFPTE